MANFFVQISEPRFTGKNLDKNKILYSRLEKLAQKHECLPAQLALSWVLHQGDDVVPIPGELDLFLYWLAFIISNRVLLKPTSFIIDSFKEQN